MSSEHDVCAFSKSAMATYNLSFSCLVRTVKVFPIERAADFKPVPYKPRFFVASFPVSEPRLSASCRVLKSIPHPLSIIKMDSVVFSVLFPVGTVIISISVASTSGSTELSIMSAIAE